MEGRTRSRWLVPETVLGHPRLIRYMTRASLPCDQYLASDNDYESTVIGDTVHEATVDTVTRNFNRVIASGGIVNNPFFRSRITEENFKPQQYQHSYEKPNWRYCSTHKKYHSLRHDVSGLLVPPEPPDPLEVPLGTRQSMRQAVIDLAVTQAHSRVDVSEMQALVSAAEARKTVESMGQILNRAIRILRSVRKLDFRRLRKELSPKELADRYMELRYAIRPVIYDAIQVRNYLSSERKRIRRTFRSDTFEDKTQLTDELRIAFIWLAEATWERECVYQVSARAGVLCDADVTTLGASGSDQLAETMVELVPFSFIADWFANIGDLVASWTPNFGINELASFVNVKETYIWREKVLSVHSISSSIGYNTISISYGQPQHLREELVLERIEAPPLPYFPRLDINLDGWKLTDLVLILRGIFRK